MAYCANVNEPILIDKEELSVLLGCSVKWIDKHTHSIPGRVKLGRSVKYLKADVLKRVFGGQLLID